MSTRLIFLLAAVTLLMTGCATGGGETPEVRRLHARAAYERGVAAFRDKQASQALAAFREAIDTDPSVAIYPNALGLLYLELQRPDLALEQFTKATGADPRFAEAHVNTGVALAEQRRWEEAVAAYRTALALPTLASSYVAYNNLGLALYNLKRLEEAEQALRFAITLESAEEPAYYHLGLVLAAEGRAEEAKMVFRRARELGPESPFGEAAAERLRAMGEVVPEASPTPPKGATK